MSGFSTSAITSIRNNKRKRLDKFERIERYIGTESAAAEHNEASEYMLHKIRNQVQEQQRQSRRKTLIVFSIVGAIIIPIVCYFLFVHEFSNEVPSMFKFGW
jgi:lipopolysaccharide/colanic/teichoic acid biosynthesis glycosyltransferase